MRKKSVKNSRINGEVMKQLGLIIRNEVKDPRISPMTSVVSAEVTNDLKYCKAYISVLGSAEELQETMAGLNNAVGFIRRELARIVNLRITPEITFIPDTSIEYGVNMSHMIDEVIKQDRDNDADYDSDSEEMDEEESEEDLDEDEESFEEDSEDTEE